MRFVLLLLLALAAPVLPGRAEVENEIPLGVEVVTGLRSDYVYRGFHLAGSTLDAQIETEIALGESVLLGAGGWVASELSGDFSEVGGYLEIRRAFGDLVEIGGTFTYQGRENGPLADGNDLSVFLQMFPARDWDFKLLGSHDFESNGWYSAFEGGWSYRFNDDTYLALSGGVSWVDDYYARKGFNDFYGRASLTYTINNTVSVTPFAGWSLLLDDDDTENDRVFAGLWFEVVF